MSSVGIDYVLQDSDVSDLVTCLSSMSHKWEQLAIALGLTTAVRDQCRDRIHIIALTNVLREWLAQENSTKPLTLGFLQSKIRGPIVGQGKLAQNLLLAFNEARGEQCSNGGQLGTVRCF